MENSANNNTKLNAELKKAFPKLDDATIALLSTKPDEFYKAVESKQSIKRDEAEKTVKKLKAECDEAGNTDSATDASAKSAPAPKVANA